MASIEHKLSNVLLRFDERVGSVPAMYYRAVDDAGEPVALPYDEGKQALPIAQPVDFMTYFGSCTWAKWQRYAALEQLVLRLRISGAPCEVELTGIGPADDAPTVLARFRTDRVADVPRLVQRQDALSPDSAATYDIAFPATAKPVVAFRLRPLGEAWLHSASYLTQVAEERLNPVRIALATTTFRKEGFILPNIELVRREVLASDEPIADGFHMFVVDNGRTLDAEGIMAQGEGVTVIPNANVGGAGGFARGMMAALDADGSDEPFTHVLLMDDDVVVSPESFKRTYNLLRLAQGRYAEAFVNGAMLTIEQPNRKTEDVARVLPTGSYRGWCDPFLPMDEPQQLAATEATDVEVKNAYGAWWYSCIPMAVVREKGLPLPLFVRCDDVEYGVRAQGTYMTLNGICVWHEGFHDRFRPSVDCYQYVRNFLIANAMDDCASEGAFLQRIQRNMRIYLRLMYYDAVELFLDGIEDYLKGPSFLEQADGEKLMKDNGARNEQLVPLGELDVKTMAKAKVIPAYLDADQAASPWLKLWLTLPYDRHLLPDALLRDEPVAVLYNEQDHLMPASMGTRTLVAMDRHGEHGAVRRMDKERYRVIRRRWRQVMADYRSQGASVKAEWKAAMPRLTSREFWEEHLGIG